MNFYSRISLRRILMIIIILLLMPALLFSTISFFSAKAENSTMTQVQIDTVTNTDKSINQSIAAPFYLSPSSYDPCNPYTMELMQYPHAEWSIDYEYVGGKDIICTWTYYKNEKKIAVDSWKQYNRTLATRAYYLDGRIIATDTFFNSKRSQCVKQREYIDFGNLECYSESGSIISVDTMDQSSSPVPPMLYWFMYR